MAGSCSFDNGSIPQLLSLVSEVAKEIGLER